MSGKPEIPMDGEEEVDLTNPEVVQKYKAAAEVAHRAMEEVMKLCKAGARIVDLCNAGDAFINRECKKAFPKKKMEKGIAFPTCVSVNNIAGHFSPLKDDKTLLAKNDVVKIDLGAHIDGFIALAARTMVVEPDGKVTGKAADVITAAQVAMNAAIHMLQIGKTNEEISDVIKRVAEAYHVSPLEGVLSHQMHRFVIDGDKVIMNKPMVDQRVEKCTVEANDVWCIDVVMSTGEGVAREGDLRTTVYKRSLETMYMLKLKASRYLLQQINRKCPVFPFTIRCFDDERQARMGVSEMASHQMVDPYPVLFEKDREIIAQFKTTVFVLPKQTIPAFTPAIPDYVNSEFTCEDEVVKAALAAPLKAEEKKPEPKKSEEKKPEEKKPEEEKAEEKK